MNCAKHADSSAVAYCRTCGKALCANCTRPVRGVIYCEECLGDKVEGTVPPSPFESAATAGGSSYSPPYIPPPPPASGPNPALAGILAGFFPFGVGAVYCGQYAKGLAHLVIFGLLMAGLSGSNNYGAGIVIALALATGFFYVYQIIDSVRSARALQVGQPVPDPFGLAQTFSAGRKMDTSKVPTGAVVLIIIGVFFLLHTAGLFEVSHFWPLILIALGGWMFATRWGLVGTSEGCNCERCRAQSLMGPAILMTIGVVAMIDSFRHVGGFGYAGAILLVIGGVKLFREGASSAGHKDPPGGPFAGPMPPTPPEPPVPPAPPTEVSHG